MAVLLIGDNEFNGRILCDGNMDTECTKFINYGDGVNIIHLYVSSGYISKSNLQLYRKTLGSTEDWALDFEIQVGGYYDYVWQGIIVYGDNTEYKVIYKGLTKYYTVTSPCVPDWQCEIPLNGYEEDGCGNRRENIDCIDQCEGVTCPDICVDTDLWYQKCEPETGNCILDRIHFNAAEECGAEPIIICRKGCAIDGSYDYYTGNLVDGECETIENSELCGYVPPDEPDNGFPLITVAVIGTAALIGLKILSKK